MVPLQLDAARLDKSAMGCLFERRTWLGDGELNSDPAPTVLVTLRGGAGGRPRLGFAGDVGDSICC